MDQEKEIKALKEKVAYLETQIEALEIRTNGHTRSLKHAADMRAIDDDTTSNLLDLAADHSERIKAIEAHLWPGIARDHVAVRRILGKNANPPGDQLDKRK